MKFYNSIPFDISELSKILSILTSTMASANKEGFIGGLNEMIDRCNEIKGKMNEDNI